MAFVDIFQLIVKKVEWHIHDVDIHTVLVRAVVLKYQWCWYLYGIDTVVFEYHWYLPPGNGLRRRQSYCLQPDSCLVSQISPQITVSMLSPKRTNLIYISPWITILMLPPKKGIWSTFLLELLFQCFPKKDKFDQNIFSNYISMFFKVSFQIRISMYLETYIWLIRMEHSSRAFWSGIHNC